MERHTKKPKTRFNTETVIYFEDPDGLGLELVFNSKDHCAGYPGGTVNPEHAFKGIYNVEIWEEGYERTAGLLTEQLYHQIIAEKGNRFRFAATDAPGNYVDIICSPDSLRGLAGSGTVHHLAFATPDARSQQQLRAKLAESELNPTPVLDRTYFTSIYFREPGGVLFEIATAGPGFSIDEPVTALGVQLMLPQQYETDRSDILLQLPDVHFGTEQFR